MAIDRQELFKLIARRPLIRTVEIADILDCEPDHVMPELRGHIERFQICVQKIRAPNGKIVEAFEFSDLFKRTDAYKLLVAEVQEKPTPTRIIEKVMGFEPPARTKWKKTKVELAIEHITKYGCVSTDDLREVLVTTAHPSCYLGESVRKGVICREGNDWFMPGTQRSAPIAPTTGSAEIETKPEEVATILPEAAIEATKIEPDAFEKQMDDLLAHLPVMAKAAAASIVHIVDPERFSQEFSCALWSNGALQLRRYGQDLAVLSANEREYLSKFLRKFI